MQTDQHRAGQVGRDEVVARTHVPQAWPVAHRQVAEDQRQEGGQEANPRRPEGGQGREERQDQDRPRQQIRKLTQLISSTDEFYEILTQ